MSGERTLLTFGPMIDSELSRLVLRRYGLAFREERHLFGWVSVLALLRAGTPQVPVLTGEGPALAGPRAIVERHEESCPPEARLLPSHEPLRTAIEADWQRFNGQLAADTAVVAYFHLLPHEAILIEPFSRGIASAFEVRLTRPLYPLMRALFTVLLQLRAPHAQDALSRIRAAVALVDARLADGRRFLYGGAPTLADFAFASAAAPLLLPTGYAAPLPPLDAMPPPMQAIVAELREHPTAALVERVYAALSLPPQALTE